MHAYLEEAQPNCQGNWDKFYQGYKDWDRAPLASGVLVETFIACLYNKHNIDKTATMHIFTNRLIFIVTIGLH